MPLNRIPVSRRLLIGSEVWLCIAQLARSKTQLGPENHNHPGAVIIAALLTCDGTGRAPIDLDCENEQLTRVLVLPELAFGVDDLETIENAVRNYNKPIVVISGAGFAKASTLSGRVDFLADVSGDRNVNFGCIWINFPEMDGEPSSYQHHFHCKNFHEQRGEVPGFDPVLGSCHLALEFEDCSIAPIICSDLLADSQQGRQNVIDQLRAYRLQRNLPVIVAASVLQDMPWHEVWSSRIDRVVDGNLVLLLANFAHDNRPNNYVDDSNRNLSGAYVNAGQITTPLLESFACSSRSNPTTKGTILRDSCEMFVAGVLRIANYSATTGRHLWIVRWGSSFAGGSFVRAKTRLQYEIPRILNRTRHLSPSDTMAVGEVMAHLQNSSETRKSSFFLSIADGPDAKSRDPNPTGDTTANTATELALCTVDALVRTPYFQWPADQTPTFEVCISQAQNIPAFDSQGYVWKSSTDMISTMAGRLQSYAQHPHPQPSLVVFGEDKRGIGLEPEDILQRDSTIPHTDDIDPAAPRITSNVVIVIPFSKAKRLSSEIINSVNFDNLADAIRDSIIESSGLRLK